MKAFVRSTDPDEGFFIHKYLKNKPVHNPLVSLTGDTLDTEKLNFKQSGDTDCLKYLIPWGRIYYYPTIFRIVDRGQKSAAALVISALREVDSRQILSEDYRLSN